MNGIRALGALVLSAFVLGACSHGATKGGRARAQSAPAPIPTAAAKQTTLHGSDTISGVIAPFQNVAITSSLTEPADSVNVVQGDHVRAGQLIAQLDTADLRAELAQQQATVVADERTAESDDAKVVQARYTATLNIGTGVDNTNSARAALAQAKTTLANDTVNLQRDKALVGNGYVAQQTVDQQQTLVNNDAAAVRSAQAALQTALTNQSVNGNNQSGLQQSTIQSAIADARAAHAAVDQARALVQQYQVMISKAAIYSPVDGEIVNRNMNPGEYPGSRTIFTIQELDKVYADLNASSADTFAIPVGGSVSMNVSGAGGHTYLGKVVAVLGQVSPGSTDFTVQVLLQNTDGKLQAGLPVTAQIALPNVAGIGIPTTAFLDDTHTTVMLADDELTDVVAKTVKVHEVSSDGTTSIVTGLKAGDNVVANGQLGIVDGQSLASN
jgi:RND family efflux transporter MFP subunit